MEMTRGETYDQGLRNYMVGIYNWLILGVVISAAGAYGGILMGLPAFFAAHSGWFLLALLVPLGIVFFMAAGNERASIGTLAIAFIALTGVEGLTLSVVLAKVSGVLVLEAFMMTAVAFAGCSLYGYTTGKSLSGLGTILLMSLIGLIVAMILGMFFQSTIFQLAICFAGVVIFALFMAYDTQKLKMAYHPGMSSDERARVSLWGALELYLDILNFFLFVLKILQIFDND